MADSPGSDDSVVTVINVNRQEEDDLIYIQLVKARRQFFSNQYKLAKDIIRKMVSYSERWHTTSDRQKKKEIGMALVEKLLVRYNHEVNKLAEKHHKDFHNDIRIQKYITGWSTNMAMMIKGSGGNMRVAIEAGKYAEPLDPDKLQAALSLFRKTFGRSIMLEKFAAYDVNPDFLTNALKDEANEERKERGRKKIFQEYQRNLILDLVSQKDFLNGFFAAGIEDMDPTFEWRLELLEQVYQQNIDSCEDWREIFTVNFMKRFGHTDFFFLNPLNRFGSKSGKERVENLGFKETGLSEAEMRQIWINAMNKIDTETKYLESRRYKPVRIND